MRFSHSLALAAAFGCALASTAYAASPLIGKWKFNAAKSKLTGASDSIAAAGPNTWKFTYGSFSWTIKADGTDQATPFGGTLALTVASPSSWQFVDKTGGKVTANETWALAADGQSMTRTSSGKHENGEAFNNVTTTKRTAGAKGFEGTWEASNIQTAPLEVDIDANGDDGVTIFMPADKTKVALKFDGKDYSFEGPRMPPGMTMAAKMAGPRKVTATSKMKDKLLDTETWEVSADGKTFTYTELDAGVDKPIVAIYDRM